MNRIVKVLLWMVLALVFVAGAAACALHRWVSTDDFRQRAEREASAALGVPVKLGSIEVDVWPLPAVALGGLEVRSTPPVTLERIEVRPRWQALLQGQLVVATLIVRKAVLPQQGIDAILVAMQKKGQTAQAGNAGAQVLPVSQPQAGRTTGSSGDLSWLPRRTVLDDVTWVSNTGTQTAVEGEAILAPDGLPEKASLRLIRGNLQGLKAELQREAGSGAPTVPAAGDEWDLRVDVGGGSIHGKLGLQRVQSDKTVKSGHELVVQGKLETRDVEVSALTAPSKPLSGRLEASSTLNARAATTAALVEAMQTQTTFTVRNAVLNGIDLAKAVKTVGMSRGGQTPLQVLSGHVVTQGRAIQLNNLVATSGMLTASGEVAVSPAKALSGHVSVNLSGDSKIGTAIGGAVAIPLIVGGTVEAPDVTLSRSALLGAALGTVLMPGVGTGAGAKLGDRVGQGLRGLFGK